MKKVTFIFALMLASSASFAQDTTAEVVVEETAPASSPLEISGSGDLYYKYDFAKVPNIGTSFASDQNSVSLGMIDIALKKKTGKTSFVGEVSFGPRGQYQSILTGDATDDTNSFHIQNLYATYEVTDKLSLTAGFMGTFVGYEVISPVANFNYSTSYLFTNGPFQNAGIKANYAINDKFGVMLGAFNDTWNTYQADASKGVSSIGAQLSYTTDMVSAYLNFMDGSESGTIVDLTASFQFTEKFKLGLNVADWSGVNDDEGYTGAAVYPIYAITDAFALGLRAEYFMSKEMATGLYGIGADQSVTAFTLTGNFKAGNLVFIPEFRLDNNSEDYFIDGPAPDGAPTKSASQVVLAVVYGF